MTELVYVTVGFKCADKEAFDALWVDIRNRYKFAADEKSQPVQAFAVAIGDKFAEQDAVDQLFDARLDQHDLAEAISRVPCCEDLPALLAEYGVTSARQETRHGE